MIAAQKALSAIAVATVALSFLAIGGEAKAQFGPMGMSMGMGMRGGPMGMGMRGGPMGGMYGGPGYGSSYGHRSRGYYYDDEPQAQYNKPRAKQAPVQQYVAPAQTKTVTPQVVSKPAVAPATAGAKPATAEATPTQAATPAATTGQPAQGNQAQQVTPPVLSNQPPELPKPAAVAVQQPQPAPAPTATPSPPAVAADSALPTRLTPETRPLNCMTKLYLKDGTVLLQDFCTLEQAVLKEGDSSQAGAPPPVAGQSKPQPVLPRDTPSQLARSR